MLIDIDYVLSSMETVRRLTAKVRKDWEAMPDGPDKVKMLCVLQGQDYGIEGLLTLLKIDPNYGKYVSEWTPPPPGIAYAKTPS